MFCENKADIFGNYKEENNTITVTLGEESDNTISLMNLAAIKTFLNGGDVYLLYGELTIKNVTKDVIFNVHYGGTAKNQQGEKLGMKAETTINRFDYDIDCDPTAAGIGKEVNIVVHLQFAKQ
ncbi:hypothetical protein D778_00324 [Xanthomarina gelatinilytica]|uniref:Lipid/polyisoprenoid-binding YceI-like domain-containing protein n=1 Tax=Xanthomarina gelatinilytica TaxID=1137281 RepID=M7MZN8_9FLAO|nr:YceI family protein [Xanthomarina gelatinilytica]EMQ94964.1 hypothetical protein D778_00324 [Xanthomarina gelatinilytica]